MPSFDVVSDFDAHEASNAVDQANREVNTRFDFKGTGSKFELEGQIISIPREFADTVVTEHGVARLLGRSVRERAEELISIAHPDHREHLRAEAQRLYYP